MSINIKRYLTKRLLVEIAKALSQDAKVLIMDEPTSALSRKEIEDLFRVIRKLRDEGRGIIYISHRLNFSLLFSSEPSDAEKPCERLGIWKERRILKVITNSL